MLGFLGGSDSKESICNAGILGSIPGSGRSLGEGNGNSLQYSCLENPMDRGAWQAVVIYIYVYSGWSPPSGMYALQGQEFSFIFCFS